MYNTAAPPPGGYTVEAPTNQRLDETAIGFFPSGAISRGTAVPVTVTDGSTTTGVDIQVLGFSGGDSPRTIRGTLRDSSGNPIPFAVIHVYEPSAQTVVRAVGANGDGSYTMDGLPPGK